MPRTVLVVDDSKLARMVVKSMLAKTRADWRVVEAANAAEAIDQMAADSVDIGLIDFNMPERDGLSLAEEIRAANPDMPMAIISANAQDAILARARELDIAFVEKPVAEEMLNAFLSGAVLKLRRVAK
ncbi:response regulator receiver [Skermanella stibiiresistens SB22]|uniref:Response regulator receiver n=1 Tax=Skermanella stibiiresistens SB22 TaxID=1385369 RepID=W9GY08_9PROT|nr:response regulator [Skermanella stibiiresistens]EWY38674.1 response regulator receiver [Skermanella stibiiresistens SB22]